MPPEVQDHFHLDKLELAAPRNNREAGPPGSFFSGPPPRTQQGLKDQKTEPKASRSEVGHLDTVPGLVQH